MSDKEFFTDYMVLNREDMMALEFVSSFAKEK